MVERGGGVLDLTVRNLTKSSKTQNILNSYRYSETKLVIHLHIDVCDAMGANCASTVAEGTAPYLAKIAGSNARVGLCIVSNFCVERLAKVSSDWW